MPGAPTPTTGTKSLISLGSISVLSGWLVFRNGLWNTVRGAAAPRRALWAMLFVVGLAVIAASYFHTELGHPVTLLDYGQLSWLAASMGALAGALGSNFDSNDAIREAIYSRRKYQRRQLADNNNE